MKKWTWIIVGIVIVIFGLLTAYYQSIRHDVNSSQKKAVQKAQQEANIERIDTVTYYHGNESYHIVQGRTQDKKNVLVFVPEKKGDLFVVAASKGMTKKEAIEQVKREQQVTELVDIRLGMEKNTPLWEIVYTDEEENYNYHYVRFTTGELYKRYTLSDN
ncbi:cell wall elongation regulator TseB-like domain-containing protein [Massilibacterium senegalense]|uniref:cell wall elongation regulator TseB-like domain-containing protein n=1 Tax=Massilibacterium senegalense TaxID=1632858 RepID=UPI0011CB0681|nr:DUF5590 domain-containing protein [Massilibacterium senegalense]